MKAQSNIMEDIITCKFGNPFGPSFVFSGYILLISGLIITIFIGPGGLILSFIGAFIAFTHSATQINLKELRVKHTINLFGIFAIGNWIYIVPEMRMVIKKSSGTYTIYSRSNRRLNIPAKEFHLIICQQGNKDCIPLLRSENLMELRAKSNELARKMGIKIES